MPDTFSCGMDISIPAPRPKYPDHIAASAPIGMRESIRKAASLRGITASAFIRDAVQEGLRRVAPPAVEGR